MRKSMPHPFCSLNGVQLSALSTLIAVKLAEGLSIEEQNALGNFLASIGSTMMTIAAQDDFCRSQATGETSSIIITR